MTPLPLATRRELLLACANGFGAVALASLSRERDYGLLSGGALDGLHHPARAKRAIFLYMDGGPSQVDTFDPKPLLDERNGEPIGMEVPATQFDDVGKVLRSPFAFTRHGECGHEISALFPRVATCADELCVVRSMTSAFPEHAGANYFLHTGLGQLGRPSMGAWITYGLGSESRDLPGFVVLNGGLVPPGGLENFASGFLPAGFQGSLLRPGAVPIANLAPSGSAERQRARLELLAELDRGILGRGGDAGAVESAIANQELAFRMQAAVPELADLSGESAATRALYGLDDEYPHARTYGTLCLLARRLCERGVRFVELTCPHVGHDRWDQHQDLEAGHRDNARAVDRPIAGLLKDLRSRGLLDDTLVVWAGEFGRTPMAQGANGRDHDPHGFTIWLAGGGARGGSVYGATDEWGYFAVEGRMTVHDLHATMLHLLGVDHTRLTYRWSGRDMRLTDVHGEVVRELLA